MPIFTPSTSVSQNSSLNSLYGSRLKRLMRWTQHLRIWVKYPGVSPRGWSGSTGLTLSNQQHWSYLHYVLIPSEPEHICLDKLIAEALPLLEAPPAVRSVHLYKLLCGGTSDRFSSSNDFPIRAFLRQETGKTNIEKCDGRFVTDPPAECGVRPTSAAQFGPNARGTLWFVTQQTHISWPLGELHDTGSKFGFHQPSHGALQLLNSDQVSCYPD
jgi:hypothetical protein